MTTFGGAWQRLALRRAPHPVGAEERAQRHRERANRSSTLRPCTMGRVRRRPRHQDARGTDPCISSWRTRSGPMDFEKAAVAQPRRLPASRRAARKGRDGAATHGSQRPPEPVERPSASAHDGRMLCGMLQAWRRGCRAAGVRGGAIGSSLAVVGSGGARRGCEDGERTHQDGGGGEVEACRPVLPSDGPQETARQGRSRRRAWAQGAGQSGEYSWQGCTRPRPLHRLRVPTEISATKSQALQEGQNPKSVALISVGALRRRTSRRRGR